MPVLDEATGQYKYAPASKLDIYAYAADINAEIWAQDEINVIAGKNQIDANGNPAAPLHSEGSGVNLDIGALGGTINDGLKATLLRRVFNPCKTDRSFIEAIVHTVATKSNRNARVVGIRFDPDYQLPQWGAYSQLVILHGSPPLQG